MHILLTRPPGSIHCCSFFTETFVFLFIHVFVRVCLSVCAPCSGFMTVMTSSLSSALEPSRCSLHHQTSPVDSSPAVPFGPSVPALPFSSILNCTACIFFFVLDDCTIFPCLPSPWPVLGSFHLVLFRFGLSWLPLAVSSTLPVKWKHFTVGKRQHWPNLDVLKPRFCFSGEVGQWSGPHSGNFSKSLSVSLLHRGGSLLC